MKINDFRREFPQYGGLSDGDIAGRLYAQYFSNMDENDFLRQFMGPIPDSVFDVERPAINTTVDLDPSDIGTSPEPSRLIQQPDPVFERNRYDADVSRYGSVPRYMLPESMSEVDPEIAARGFERSAEVSKFEAAHPDADLRAWLTARLAPTQAFAGGLMQQAGEALSFVGDMIPNPIATLLSNPQLREQLKQDNPELYRRTEALQAKVRGVRDSFLNNPAIAKASGWLIDRAEINRQIGQLGAPEQEQLRALYDAAGAVPDMAFEIAGGLLGGSPIALTTMFTRVYIDELGRSKRIEGLGAEEANMNAAVSAMAEVLPEIPVFNKIFGRAPGAKAGMKDALKVMMLEGGSEMVTELINIADETLRQGKPFSWDEAVKRVRMAGQTGAAMGPMMLGATSVAAKAGEIYGRIPSVADAQDQRDLEALLERSSGLMNTYNESPSGGVLPAFDAAFNQATRDIDIGLDKIVQDEVIEIDRLSAELDRQFIEQDVPLPEVIADTTEPVLGSRARARQLDISAPPAVDTVAPVLGQRARAEALREVEALEPVREEPAPQTEATETPQSLESVQSEVLVDQVSAGTEIDQGQKPLTEDTVRFLYTFPGGIPRKVFRVKISDSGIVTELNGKPSDRPIEDYGDYYLSDTEIDDAFERWYDAQEEATPTAPAKPETTSETVPEISRKEAKAEVSSPESATIGEHETQYQTTQVSEDTISTDDVGRGADGISGELFTPEDSVLEPNPTPRVKLVQTGTFRTGITQATTPEDIAHVAAPLRKEAQENLIAVVTDGEGQVLSVIRHTIGGIDASQVYPGIVSGAVASITGAKNAWFVHNHPTGAAKQSRPDIVITNEIDDLLRGSGIDSRGMIVVAPGGEASYYDPNAGGSDSVPISITPQARGSSVPVSERKLRNLSKLSGKPAEGAITGRNLIQTYSQGQPGVMLLDTKHNPLQFVPVSREEMGRLRTGDASTGVAKLLRIAHENNAKSGLISAPFLRGSEGLDEVRNLGECFLRRA